MANTGKDINDLGRFSACITSDKTRYVLLSIEEVVPLGLYLGICGPLNCTAQTYSFLFSARLAELIQDTLDSSGIEGFTGLNVTADNVRFYDSVQEDESLHDIKAGNIVAIAVYSVLLLCVLIGSLMELRPHVGLGSFMSNTKQQATNYKIPQDVALTGRESVTTFIDPVQDESPKPKEPEF